MRFVFLLIFLKFVEGLINENRLIENDLLRIYDRKHRPVKLESTIISVQVYIMINHIEKVVSFNLKKLIVAKRNRSCDSFLFKN